jgi:hypothetical protein
MHYYGLYSSRCKARWHRWTHVARVAPPGWKETHAEVPPADPAPMSRPQTVTHAACHSSWARLLAKVYEIDPLRCPRCGSEMKPIAIITDPSEVRKILRHLLKIGRAPPGLEAASLI